MKHLKHPKHLRDMTDAELLDALAEIFERKGLPVENLGDLERKADLMQEASVRGLKIKRDGNGETE